MLHQPLSYWKIYILRAVSFFTGDDGKYCVAFEKMIY